MATDADRLALRLRLDELLQRHAELSDRLAMGQKNFQRLARSVWRVQEEERRRFARELHDGVGQNLTALLRLIADAQAEAEAAQPATPTLMQTLRQAHALTESTWQDTRTLSRLLRPQILDDLGLEPALRWLVRSIATEHGPQFRIDLPAALPELDSERSTLVFRVVQEALANAERHAGAKQVSVQLAQRQGRLRVRVEDDGRGCNPDDAWQAGSSGRSSGLGGMRDRVQLFGGEVRIETRPGAGFIVMLDLPLADAETEEG